MTQQQFIDLMANAMGYADVKEVDEMLLFYNREGVYKFTAVQRLNGDWVIIG